MQKRFVAFKFHAFDGRGYMKQRITVANKEGILTIKLNMPERLNVLDVETRKEIMDVMKSCEKDEDVKCVVFRAEGKAFSAGADLRYILTLKDREAKKYASFVKMFLKYVENYPRPTVGVVEGIAVGGGLELLLALDIVIATEESMFGQTELNVGLIPGGGGTQRLPLVAGPRVAKEMVFTSRLITAWEAKEAGIVNRVVKKEVLDEELKKITKMIVEKDTMLLEMAKKAINYGMRKGIDRGIELESRLYSSLLQSKETKDAIKRFLER